MNANPNGRRRMQVVTKKRTRPRRLMPPPIVGSPEVLAEALFSLPESHIWVFMKGKSFRD